ncbi:MAG: class I SAM-dependent methyltransferase [Bacteroidota bacterium]
MERFAEAFNYLSSFSNTDARHFVRSLMKENYAGAVLTHHPHPEQLNRNEVQEKCSGFVDRIFEEINALADPGDLFPLFNRLSRNSKERQDIWFDEFLEAYENYKHRIKLENRYQQLRPFIYGTSYCDVGCGGGDLVAYIKRNHPDVEEAAGIDVLDWRSDSVKDIIDFQMLDLTRPDATSSKAYDTVTCLAVLHHIDNQSGGLEYFLRNLKTAIKLDGRLVVEEDVMLSEEEINADQTIKEQIDQRRTRQPMFDRFLHFDLQTQRDIITIIDFLSNTIVVGVPEMPFPCSFQTLNGWRVLFEEKGFAIDEIRVEGFVPHRFNQSSHVIFVLGK